MKFNNLLNQIDRKELVLISETEVTNGNFKGEKRIVLIREKAKPVVLVESNYNFYRFSNLLEKEIMAEIYDTNYSDVVVSEGTLKQVRANLEEIL